MDGLALKTLLDRARDQRDSSSDDPDEIKKQFEVRTMTYVERKRILTCELSSFSRRLLLI